MTHILRIPSAEAYGYTESPFEGTAEEAIQEQIRLSKVAKGEDRPGLSDKDWMAFLDCYLTDKGMNPEQFEVLNRAQGYVINQIRKSRARTGTRGSFSKDKAN